MTVMTDRVAAALTVRARRRPARVARAGRAAQPPVSTDEVLCGRCADALRPQRETLPEPRTAVTGWNPTALRCGRCGDARSAPSAAAQRDRSSTGGHLLTRSAHDPARLAGHRGAVPPR